MKKRLLSLLLVLCMVLTLVPTTAFAVEGKVQTPSAANPFTDVKEGDWCYDAVQYARMNGFFNGTSNKTFTPNGTMTRAMFVTVLGRMAGVDTELYEDEKPFSDVPSRMYYAPYVAWAYKHGITGGTGDGKFSPDGIINRQQMATFYVRYFEAFDVDYETGANIETVPADMDSVAPYAKDAVLKLWKQGLLNGDGTNFNPGGNATRAQAATLSMRTDEAVETWYKEPGVPSDRVSIDPEQVEGETEVEGEGDVQTPPGSSSSTKYYKVVIHNGESSTEELHRKGTLLNNIMPPVMDNDTVFLGWFHDSALTQMVGADEVLRGDMELYAKVGAVSALEESGKPSFIAKMDVTDTSASRFTVRVKWADGRTADIIPGIMKDGAVVPADANVVFRNITQPQRTDGYEAATDLEPDESVTINGGVIRGDALYNPGSTYQIELLDENLIFNETMDNGDPADEYVRYFNFSIKKAEVMNLDLNPDMIYIPAGDLDESDRENAMEYVGLYQVTYDPQTEETTYTPNAGTGSFSYSGPLKNVIDVGDTVAVYEGTVRPDERGKDDTGEVVYMTITNIRGTTYYYEAADHKDVLFTPDILPIDTDGESCGVVSNTDGTLVINSGKLDFSTYTDIGLDATTTVDTGDYLFFYTGEYGPTGSPVGYGLITEVSIGAETATITYTSVNESDVLKSMEMFVEEEPSEEQLMEGIDVQAVRESVAAQIMESDFVAETGAYLAEMALRTDEVESVLGEGVTLEDVMITLPDGSTVSGDELELMDGNVLHKGENVKLDVAITLKLTHFEDASGIRLEVSVNYEFDIQKKGSDKKINVSLTAFFEQEVKMGISVSGEAVWKKAWIIPYIADYQLSANMDLGSYTGVGITATAKTDEDESISGMPWPKTAAEKEGTKKVYELSNSIKKEMEETKGVFKEGENSASGELADKYANMLEEADDSWIDLFVVNIFEKYEAVAPYYILAYGIKIDFVVSANLYVALGVTFQYEASKRYTFAILVEASEAGSDVVETGTNGFRFDAYVMGTMGLKAGIRVKVLAGLFNCKLDGIGVQAEAGAYIQLWGYFYFSYSNYKDMEADPPVWENKKEFTGALLIEIGAYLDVNFVAEVLDGKYAWTPSLYSNTWPLLQIGERENVNDFAYDANDPSLYVEVLEKNTVTLPTSLFDMKYMDLTSGDQYGEKNDDGEWKTNKSGDVLAAKNFDGNAVGSDADDEERFYITMSNGRFTYDPTTNTVTIDTAGTVEETCEMTITWAGTPLAFTNNLPTRTVTIDWSNPEGMRYIQFNSTGGSSVKMARGPERGKITWPADPTKTGYTFGGWYYDQACTRTFDGSKTQLPENFGTNGDGSIIKGITLYAKWNPAPNRITVEHYQQGLNNRYELFETEVIDSSVKTDDVVSFTGLDNTYSGFTHEVGKAVTSHATVQADGSTVVKLYYSRNKYTVTFNVNYPEGSGINVVNSIYFGADIAAAKALCPGYVFDGWYTSRNGTTEYDFTKTMPAQNVTVYAHWKPAEDTHYSVAHYIQAANGGYILKETEDLTGTTNADTEATAKDYEGFSAESFTQKEIASDGSTVVVIQYRRSTYELTWNYNDGQTPTTTTENIMFEQTIVAPTPEREGHTFTGWKYEDGSAYQAGDTMPGEAITLIAQWDIQSYNLSYDLAGGKLGDSATIAPEVKEYAAQITAPATPVRTGYTFNGWADQQKIYAAEETFNMPARDVKLVAQWTANPYTVTFDVNGDEVTCDTANGEFTYDQTYGTLPTPTRIGHDFDGWFTAAEGGEKVTAATMMTTASAHTLYAHWTIKRYSITFKDHDGTTVTTVQQNYKTAVTAPEVTRTGYTFAGWYLGTSLYTVGTMPAEDITLYAKWTAQDDIAYRIDVYRQNADGSWPVVPESSPESGTADSTVNVTANRFNQTGFTYDSGNGNNVTSGTVAPDGSLVLKLYYTRNQYNFIVNYDDGATQPTTTSVYYGAPIAAPADPTRTGYTFTGWDKTFVENETMPAGDVTVTAQWTANPYTVTFDANGGTCGTATDVFTYDQAYGTLPTPTRTGYSFGGWFTAAEGGVQVTASTVMTSAIDHTLYAHWTINQYTIEWKVDGKLHDSQTDDYGTAVKNVAAPTKAGYEFTGWDQQIPDGKIPVNGMTLNATWNVVTYGVTYDYQGGTTAANPATYTVESNITLNEPTRTGYDFAGWFYKGNEVTKLPIAGVYSNVELVATWTAVTYNISYDLAGGTVNKVNPSTYTILTEDFALNNPTRLGYTFAGWTGTGLTSASTSVTIRKDSYGARSYTANWTPISYTINYTHKKGGTVIDIASGVSGLKGNWTVETSGVTENDADGTLTLTLPTPEYQTQQYTFAGYSGAGITNTDSGYQLTVNADPNNTQIYVDVTVNWTENETKLTVYSGTTGDGTFFTSTTPNDTYTLSNMVEIDGKTYFVSGWKDESGKELYTSKDVTVEAFVTKTYRPIAVAEIPTTANSSITYTYDIYTGEQLKALAAKLNKNCTYEFNLRADITLTDWTTSFNCSYVTFNGNGKTITFGTGCTAPLFDLLYSANFSNLTTKGTISGGKAALVGKISLTKANASATFRGCINYVPISAGAYSGGLVGELETSVSTTVVLFDDCKNHAAITCTNWQYSCGGLVGGGNNCSENIRFVNCENTGAITSTDGSYVGAGGLMGALGSSTRAYCKLTFIGCSNSGNITSLKSSAGLLGYVATVFDTITVTNCTVSGTITASEESNSYAGHYVGMYNEGTPKANTTVTVTGSSSTATLNAAVKSGQNGDNACK